MLEILVAVTAFYGAGALAACWAGHRGHETGIWMIGAALWGAVLVPALVVARLIVRLRPATVEPPAPAHPKGESPDGHATGAGAIDAGATIAIVMDVDDSPVDLVDRVRTFGEPVGTLVIIALVSEEARGRFVAGAEVDHAKAALRRMLRRLPPVRTTTAITSLSGLERLGGDWRADAVVAGPNIGVGLLGGAVARAVDALGPRVDGRRPAPMPTAPLTAGTPSADSCAPVDSPVSSVPPTPPTPLNA